MVTHSFLPAYTSTIIDFFKISLTIIKPQEVLEIALLTTLLHTFMRWLNRDTNKQLISAWISYHMLIILCYITHLYTASFILFFSSPVVLTLLVIAHQQSLQRNCIAYKVVKPADSEDSFKWLDILMQAYMSNAHKQNYIICVIERFDSLESILDTRYLLNADMCMEVLELYTYYQKNNSTYFSHNSTPFLWVHHSGKIRSVNSYITSTPESIWLTEASCTLPEWKKNALVLTDRTDALVAYLCPQTRLFECIVAGTSVESLTPGAALLLIKEYLIKQTINGKKELTGSAYNSTSYKTYTTTIPKKGHKEHDVA